MRQLILLTLLIPGFFSSLKVSPQSPEQAAVRAVLFYSPSCGHCHYVITEVIQPMMDQYGDGLLIIGIDISQDDGFELFSTVLEYFNLERGGVPFLVFGDRYLVGSVDIPEQFPGLVEQYLAQGGLDWPEIPGLAEALPVTQETPKPTPAPAGDGEPASGATLTEPDLEVVNSAAEEAFMSNEIKPGLWERLTRDLTGNILAIVVLAGMLLVGIGGIYRLLHPSEMSLPSSRSWLIPVLCITGLAVAGYLAYVETAQVEAVCGPVGDCNTVQQSQYARLFGVFPIGILGMAGYVLILLAWLLERSSNRHLAACGGLALFVFTSFGLLFSVYLTFLEPFVIGATCAWCLTSAVVMTGLFWSSVAPGKKALLYLTNRQDGDLHKKKKAVYGTHVRVKKKTTHLSKNRNYGK